MRSQQLFHEPPLRRNTKEKRSTGHEAIVAFQHILLWTSLYVLASEVYMLASGAVTSEVLASSILLLTSVRTSASWCTWKKPTNLTSGIERCRNSLHCLPHYSLNHISTTTNIACQRRSLDNSPVAGKAEPPCGSDALDGGMRSQHRFHDSKTATLHTEGWRTS